MAGEKKDTETSSNAYGRFDALLKSLMSDFSKQLIRMFLGLNVTEIQPLDKERPKIRVSRLRTDFLAKIRYVDNKGKEKETLLHIEFQTSNDP